MTTKEEMALKLVYFVNCCAEGTYGDTFTDKEIEYLREDINELLDELITDDLILDEVVSEED